MAMQNENSWWHIQMKSEDIFKKYVDPVYGPLMGNAMEFQPVEEQLIFKQKMAEIVTDQVLTDDMLKLLLWNSNWRCSLVGAWLIFIKNKTAFTDDICKFLLQSRGGVIGYCFALAKFGTLTCSENLVSYLEKELHFDKFPTERFQDTAMYALVYLDNKNATTFSKQFLEPNGLWTKFIECKYLKEHQLKDSVRWGQFDENYKSFVSMFDFMNTLAIEGGL
jgi:hypothetical protein